MAALHHLIRIRATPRTVYRALTEAAGLQGWWTTEATAVPREGAVAEFRFGDRYHDQMGIVRLDQDRRVEWICLAGDPEWVGTTLVFALEGTDEGTVVRFTHARWAEKTDFFAACNTHWGHYMGSLKAYCETGEGTPYGAA